jgi:hypothetical protein
VVHNATVLDVSIVAGYHNLDSASVGYARASLDEPSTKPKSPGPVEVNTAIFEGSIINFSKYLHEDNLLDTPDQFDYDSACTMILNLESSVGRLLRSVKRASI